MEMEGLGALQHMTVTDFAAAFGVSPRTVESKISLINRGKADPGELPRYRRVFGKPVFFLRDVETWAAQYGNGEPCTQKRRPGRPRKSVGLAGE